MAHLGLFQRFHVNHIPKVYLPCHDIAPSIIYLLDGDNLHLRIDVVGDGIVDSFLRFAYAANQREPNLLPAQSRDGNGRSVFQNQNHDLFVKFEQLLDGYFHNGTAQRIGLPTVQYCADSLNLSPNYFSDLLKKETGTTTLRFIHDKAMEIAKTELVSTSDTVNEIAYRLGFQYPQHFTRLFKKEVGFTPNEYRQQVG